MTKPVSVIASKACLSRTGLLAKSTERTDWTLRNELIGLERPRIGWAVELAARCQQDSQ